jgi:hypothetical protein
MASGCLTITPADKGDAAAVDASSSSSSSGAAVDPVKTAIAACKDAANANGQAGQRCGQDYKVWYVAFLDANANGDCETVVSVRDEKLLRSVCIPSLASVDCQAFFQGKLNAACQRQF